MAKAARYFSKKLDHDVSKSTVVSTKRAYLEGMKENRAKAEEDDGDLAVLPAKKMRKTSAFER